MPDRIKVLIIDDHRMFAEALVLLLRTAPDIEVVGIAGAGEEAVERCRDECPDVVLMDIGLPGMDGVTATRRIKEECADTHVVVISALQPNDVVAAAIEAGASGFIPKTEAADNLLSVIRRAAEGEVVLPAGRMSDVLERLRHARDDREEADLLLAQLTERELQLLQAIADGRSTAETAEALFISEHTVQSHVRSILAKLGVRSKLEAVLFALRHGAIQLRARGPREEPQL